MKAHPTPTSADHTLARPAPVAAVVVGYAGKAQVADCATVEQEAGCARAVAVSAAAVAAAVVAAVAVAAAAAAAAETAEDWA